MSACVLCIAVRTVQYLKVLMASQGFRPACILMRMLKVAVEGHTPRPACAPAAPPASLHSPARANIWTRLLNGAPPRSAARPRHGRKQLRGLHQVTPPILQHSIGTPFLSVVYSLASSICVQRL